MSGSKVIPRFVKFSSASGINPEFFELMKKSNNPHIVAVSGPSRIGKSSTCNNLINGPIDGFKNNTEPFRRQSGGVPITIGCDVYGPVSLQSIYEKHNININQSPDADLFFIDTEGLKSLYGFSTEYLSSILTILQISATTIHFCSGFPATNNISELGDSLELSKFITESFKIKTPNQVLYATRCDFDGDDEDDDISEKQILAELENKRKKYQIDFTNQIQNKFKLPLNVIISSNYKQNPKKKDFECQVYWNSIRDLIHEIGANIQNNHKPQNQEETIVSVFNFFSKFKSNTTSIDIDLKEMSINIAKQLLNEESSAAMKNIQYSLSNYQLDNGQKEDVRTRIIDILNITEPNGKEDSDADYIIKNIMGIIEQADKNDKDDKKAKEAGEKIDKILKIDALESNQAEEVKSKIKDLIEKYLKTKDEKEKFIFDLNKTMAIQIDNNIDQQFNPLYINLFQHLIKDQYQSTIKDCQNNIIKCANNNITMYINKMKTYILSQDFLSKFYIEIKNKQIRENALEYCNEQSALINKLFLDLKQKMPVSELVIDFMAQNQTDKLNSLTSELNKKFMQEAQKLPTWVEKKKEMIKKFSDKLPNVSSDVTLEPFNYYFDHLKKQYSSYITNMNKYQQGDLKEEAEQKYNSISAKIQTAKKEKELESSKNQLIAANKKLEEEEKKKKEITVRIITKTRERRFTKTQEKNENVWWTLWIMKETSTTIKYFKTEWQEEWEQRINYLGYVVSETFLRKVPGSEVTSEIDREDHFRRGF